MPQQASSAAEQSAALTQTTTTIEEVKAIAAQTAQQASQVAQESQAALDVARRGTQAVEETVIGMVQTAQRLGPALGPVIGGVLAQMVGLRRSFWFAGGFYAIGFVLVVAVGLDRLYRSRTLKGSAA